MKAIEVKNLNKSFGDLQAVHDVNFQVNAGEILGLLGPNGAGKSTTISMLSGLLNPTGGDASIMGHSVTKEPAAAKASLGVVPQDIALYPDLSARENLVFWGKMYGMRGVALKSRVKEVLEVIGLADRQKDKVGKFSGGMKRRVNIGAALLHIAIMDKGKLIAYGTYDELIKIVGEKTRIDITINAEAEKILPAWQKTEGVSEIDSTNGKITALVDDSNRVLPRLFDTAAGMDIRITSVDIKEPNLETVFLHLTGRALRD